MKKKSFIGRVVLMMAVQLFLLVIILIFFVLFSYHAALENMNTSIDNLMEVYGKQLENNIENADMLLERLIYKNTDYDMLQSENESERYYASIELRNLIDESFAYNPYVDAVVIAESQYGTSLEQESVSVSLSQRNALREFAMERARKGSLKTQWDIQLIGETPYVYKMYVWQGKATGLFISIDSFMDMAVESKFKKMSLLLTDEKDAVWGVYGNKIPGQKLGKPIYELPDYKIEKNKYVLAEGKINLYSYVSTLEILSQIRINVFVILFFILVSLVSAIILVKNIRKEIIKPMKNMNEIMTEIQKGNSELRIATEYSNNEFSILKDTFNSLMDEIMSLKIKSYEKKIELAETELKCIRLQIRPHFFLNAMTTISSLSMQNRNNEIKTYIDALSKNIRYMFKSGLHTVTLEEEIRHVGNYFEMQELKYPGCVFYSIEIAPELNKWRIPQMLIHTIIENEYKYAITLDSLLTILIKASKVTNGKEEMLLLEIEDDGKGYPKEILHQFDQGETKPGKEGSRVGLWSIKRIMKLMYNGENLFQISNIKPHGCVNRFWIPEHPVHELEYENIQTKFD